MEKYGNIDTTVEHKQLRDVIYNIITIIKKEMTAVIKRLQEACQHLNNIVAMYQISLCSINSLLNVHF